MNSSWKPGFYLVKFLGNIQGVSRWDGKSWRTVDGRDIQDLRVVSAVELLKGEI